MIPTNLRLSSDAKNWDERGVCLLVNTIEISKFRQKYWLSLFVFVHWTLGSGSGRPTFLVGRIRIRFSGGLDRIRFFHQGESGSGQSPPGSIESGSNIVCQSVSTGAWRLYKGSRKKVLFLVARPFPLLVVGFPMEDVFPLCRHTVIELLM